MCVCLASAAYLVKPVIWWRWEVSSETTNKTCLLLSFIHNEDNHSLCGLFLSLWTWQHPFLSWPLFRTKSLLNADIATIQSVQKERMFHKWCRQKNFCDWSVGHQRFSWSLGERLVVIRVTSGYWEVQVSARWQNHSFGLRGTWPGTGQDGETNSPQLAGKREWTTEDKRQVGEQKGF